MKVFFVLVFFFPFVASAQSYSLQNVITNFLSLTNRAIIPFLLGVAFLLFIINVVRFFFIQGGEEDGRTNAKNLAVYSVLAFVIITILWGAVNLLASSIGLDDERAPTPDYVELHNRTFRPSPPNYQPGPCTQTQVDFDKEFGGPCANAPVTLQPPENTPVQSPPISDELEGAPEESDIPTFGPRNEYFP